MANYIKTEEEFEGTSIERIFSTDQLSLELWVARTAQEIRESNTDVLYEVGIGGSVISTPIIHKGIVYVGCCDRNMYAIDLEGKEVWRFSTGGVVYDSAIYEDTLYFGSFDSNFYALDLNGKLKWKFPCKDKIGCMPVVYKDTLYFGSKDKNFYALSLEGKLLWKFTTNERLATMPVGHGNNIYVDGFANQKFYCLDIRNGDLKWEFKTNGLVGPAIIHNNTLFFGSLDKNLYALTLDGKLKWKRGFSFPLTPERTMIINNRLYIGDYEGNLFCLSTDGKILWKFPTKEILYSRPIFHEGKIYIGSGDSNFYCLEEETGKLVWKFVSGGPITTDAALSGDKLVYGGYDCKIYCLSTEGKLLWKFPTSLSYLAPVAVPPPPKEKQAFQIVWPSEEPIKTEEKYKSKGVEDAFSGSVYSGLDVGYTGGSVYTSKKKRYG